MPRILIADDSFVTQLSLSHILEKAGYQVSLANDGQEALDFLRSQAVDLLISDISMPLVDGLTLVQLLRADEAHAALKIILVTGTQEQLSQAQNSTANSVLTKPVSSWQVTESVAQALEVQ